MPVHWDTKYKLVTRFPNHLGSPLEKQLPNKTKAFISHQYFCRKPPSEKFYEAGKKAVSQRSSSCALDKHIPRFASFACQHGFLTFCIFFVCLCSLLGNTVLSLFTFFFLLSQFCLCNPRRTAQFYPLYQSWL